MFLFCPLWFSRAMKSIKRLSLSEAKHVWRVKEKYEPCTIWVEKRVGRGLFKPVNAPENISDR